MPSFNLIMREVSPREVELGYIASNSISANVKTKYSTIDKHKVAKALKKAIPDEYQEELKRQSLLINTLVDERRAYLAKLREILQPQAQETLDAYIDNHPEELL